MNRQKSTNNAAQADFYRDNGYLIADGVFSSSEIEALKQESTAMFEGRHEVRGVVPRGPGETEAEMLSRYLCIHYPHKISGVLLETTRHPGLVEILRCIIGPNVKSMQTMLFVKGPGKRGQGWHQDENFIPTRDRSLSGVWIAMDDADTENGGLWVIPGSQRPGIIWPMAPSDDTRITGPEGKPAMASTGFPFTEEDAVPVELQAGSVVFFNGYLLHRSLDNFSADRFRRALVVHVMSAESLLPWSCSGRFELKDDMRDIFMICGKDPYAWKGTEDLLEPYLRGEAPEVFKQAATKTAD
jgi:phytanoyl-CoA hydroxylase